MMNTPVAWIDKKGQRVEVSAGLGGLYIAARVNEKTGGAHRNRRGRQ